MALYFVFDVESVGLQGVGFACGWVVVNETGRELGSGLMACGLSAAVEVVDGEDVLWCQENVIPALAATMDKLIAVPDPKALRMSFWSHWQQWKAQGAVMVADCPWPVEARFLHQCIDTRFGKQRIAGDFDGPYSLIDVASVRLAKGLDPLETGDRLPNELPAHNPMTDSRQSARLLIEALGREAATCPKCDTTLAEVECPGLEMDTVGGAQYGTVCRVCLGRGKVLVCPKCLAVFNASPAAKYGDEDERPTHARPFAEWHEDFGHNVLWWRVPIAEAPYLGEPYDSDWPFSEDDEASLWWTPINAIANAVMSKAGA